MAPGGALHGVGITMQTNWLVVANAASARVLEETDREGVCKHVAVSRHHRGDDATLVIRSAFDAMDRVLNERAQRRRGEVKAHVPRARESAAGESED
jgi:hypothetical protein